eukprot:348441_1
MTFYHDGTKQKGHDQESILFSFDIEEFDECERGDDGQYTPDATDGIIFRGIWHNNVPSTTAQGILDWAVTPAINDRVKDTTAQKTSHLIGEKLESSVVYKNICFQHQCDNNLKAPINRLLYERIQNESTDLELLQRTKNMTILDICNDIQKTTAENNYNLRNQGSMFGTILGHRKNLPFPRVVGERRTHQIPSCEAALSRRATLKRFSMMKEKNKSGNVVYNARVIYEYTQSNILLKENLVLINIGRVFSKPMLLLSPRKMNESLPIIKETLDTLKAVIDLGWNSVILIGFVLCLSSLSKHIRVHVLDNKIEEQFALECICDVGGMTKEIASDGTVDIFAFVEGASKILEHVRFEDKYYRYLFSLNQEQFTKLLKSVYGCYKVIYYDMIERYNKQSTAPPNSMVTTNDRCESMQGSSKYYQGIKQKISELSRAARVLCDINKDMWYSYDWLRENDFDEFMRLLIFWFYQCGTYKEKKEAKDVAQNKYDEVRRAKALSRVRDATSEIPQVPSYLNISQKRIATGVDVKFDWIDSMLWDNWCVKRNDCVKDMAGAIPKLIKDRCLVVLHDWMKKNESALIGIKRNKRWKIKKSQSVLYEFCRDQQTKRNV